MKGKAQAARPPSKRRGLWTCPACKRRFGKTNQSHSCATHTVDQHLQRTHPNAIRAYDALVARLKKLGPLRIDAVKSSINLSSKYHFAGISVRAEYLRVGFLAEELLEDERIVRVEKLGPRRIEHVVVLRSPDDVDATVASWFENAYRLQSR